MLLLSYLKEFLTLNNANVFKKRLLTQKNRKPIHRSVSAKLVFNIDMTGRRWQTYQRVHSSPKEDGVAPEAVQLFRFVANTSLHKSS